MHAEEVGGHHQDVLPLWKEGATGIVEDWSTQVVYFGIVLCPPLHTFLQALLCLETQHPPLQPSQQQHCLPVLQEDAPAVASRNAGRLQPPRPSRVLQGGVREVDLAFDYTFHYRILEIKNDKSQVTCFQCDYSLCGNCVRGRGKQSNGHPEQSNGHPEQRNGHPEQSNAGPNLKGNMVCKVKLV